MAARATLMTAALESMTIVALVNAYFACGYIGEGNTVPSSDASCEGTTTK
jgi:hypothetical protein